MDSLMSDLNLMVTTDIHETLPRPQQQSQNILQIDPVGIEDQAAAVKNLLDLDLDGAARAVITKLQEKIILDVGGMRNEINNISEGQRELSKVLEKQPCFLFIDNVVNKKHVQDILPKKLSLPSQSRILITSRENNMRQVLDLECEEYSVDCLPPETARKLLHQIILDGDTYKTNEKEKIDAVADACGGVPLLLEVYGKHLRDDRTESAYQEALDSLRKGERGAYKEKDLSAKLLFVYHKMRDGDTKDAFLDICWFFHGWQRDRVSAIVGERELVALNRGALLKINEENRVIVHDVIKVMGIDKAKHTRLQSLQDLKMALEENKNLNKIKGIWLPDNTVLFHLESKHLDAMCDSLRVLSIGDWIKPEGQCQKKFKNLRYLHVGDVDAFPFNKASKIENLTVLYSKSVGAMDFREGFEHLSVLTDLTLNGCKSLREFPKTVGGLRSLKSLSMEVCENLIGLPEDLGSLSYLHQLILKDCKNLKTLPENAGNLVSLEELTICGCKSLAGLPIGFGNLSLLISLDLFGCESFVELPQSFGDLCNLSELEVNGWNSMKTLPIQNLSSLKSLKVFECSKFVFIPIYFGQLTSLQSVDLSGCLILKEFPEGFSELPLQNLSFDRYSSLTSLPPNLKLLEDLWICDCNSLTSLPDGFGRKLTNLIVWSCAKFERVSIDFECLTSLRRLQLSKCPMLEAMTMDKVVKLKNLFSVNISGSVKLEEKWEQMQKEEDQCSLVVETSTEPKTCELVDANGQCIPSSEFTTTHDSFIFVIAVIDDSPWKFQPQVFQKMVERLTSKRVPIIYVEVDYLVSSCQSNAHCDEENIRKTLELLPDGSRAISSTYFKTRCLLGAAVGLHYTTPCRVIIADVKADEKGLKRFVHRNDISGEIWPHEPDTPVQPDEKKGFVDNILELEDTLEAIQFTDVCTSHGLDYFLRANDHSKVSIGALEGKVVAIFMCNLDTLEFFKLEECYNILQQKHCNFEAVWFPTLGYWWSDYGVGDYGFGSNVRRIKSMPLLLVSDPLSLPLPLTINKEFSRVILFDENGRLVKDAKPLVLRWGAEAYPFSEEKIEELKRKEFDDMQRQSTLEFVLGDRELEDSLGATVMFSFELSFTFLLPKHSK
eukprot:Gb_31365 [translate_table: standard]